jgi:hypothetical protein
MRILFDSAGLSPLVEIAIKSAPRSTTDGTMKLLSPGGAITFTRTCFFLHSLPIPELTSGRPVAAMTIEAPAMSSSSNVFARWVIFLKRKVPAVCA